METENFYKNILKTNGISDPVSKVTVKASGAKGDGLASVTENVIIEFESDKPPLQIFIKTHTDNPAHEAFINEAKAFEKESSFFMEYFPEARKVCEKAGMSELLDIYPKCYYGDEKIIVLENVVLERGFEMTAHSDRHDFEMAKLVLVSMAKYHALSHAVLKQYVDKEALYKRFSCFHHNPYEQPIMCKIMNNFCENALQTTMVILEKNLGDTGADAVEMLKSFEGKCVDMSVKSLKWNPEEPFFVLGHGDFKNNNMMFRKNQETGKLDYLLLDFQMLQYNSPGFDLVTYLYSSVSHPVRQTRLKDLLEIYREALNNFGEKLACPINWSYENMFLEYRKKSFFGIMIGLSMIGPGMGLVKESGNIDIEHISMEELADLFRDNLIKWIDQHPEKGKEMANEITDLLNHYKEVRLD